MVQQAGYTHQRSLPLNSAADTLSGGAGGTTGRTTASNHNVLVTSQHHHNNTRVPSARLHLPTLRSSTVNDSTAASQHHATISSQLSANRGVVRPASALRRSLSMQPTSNLHRHHVPTSTHTQSGHAPATHQPLHRHLSLHRGTAGSSTTHGATAPALQPHPPPGSRGLTRHTSIGHTASLTPPAGSAMPWSPLAMVAAGAMDTAVSRQQQPTPTALTEPSWSIGIDEPSIPTRQLGRAAVTHHMDGANLLGGYRSTSSTAGYGLSGGGHHVSGTTSLPTSTAATIGDKDQDSSAVHHLTNIQQASSPAAGAAAGGVATSITTAATSSANPLMTSVRRSLYLETHRIMDIEPPSPSGFIYPSPTMSTPQAQQSDPRISRGPITPLSTQPSPTHSSALMSPPSDTMDTIQQPTVNTSTSITSCTFPTPPLPRTLQARRPLLAPRSSTSNPPIAQTSTSTPTTSIPSTTTNTTTTTTTNNNNNNTPAGLQEATHPDHHTSTTSSTSSGYGAFKQQTSTTSTTAGPMSSSPTHQDANAPTTPSSLDPVVPFPTTPGADTVPLRPASNSPEAFSNTPPTLRQPAVPSSALGMDSTASGVGTSSGMVERHSPGSRLRTVMSSTERNQRQQFQQQPSPSPRFAVGLEGLQGLMNLGTQMGSQEASTTSTWPALSPPAAPHTPQRGMPGGHSHVNDINHAITTSQPPSQQLSTWGDHLYSGHMSHHQPMVPMPWRVMPGAMPYTANRWTGQQWRDGSELWNDMGEQAAVHIQQTAENPHHHPYHTSTSTCAAHQSRGSVSVTTGNQGRTQGSNADADEATVTSVPARLLPVGWRLRPGAGVVSEYSTDDDDPEEEEDPEGDEERVYRLRSESPRDEDNDDEEDDDDDEEENDENDVGSMSFPSLDPRHTPFTAMYDPSPWTSIPDTLDLGHHHLMSHYTHTPGGYDVTEFRMLDDSDTATGGSARLLLLPGHRRSEPLRGGSPSSCGSSGCQSSDSSANSSSHQLYVGGDAEDARTGRTEGDRASAGSTVLLPGHVSHDGHDGHSASDINASSTQRAGPRQFRPLLPRLIQPTDPNRQHSRHGEGSHGNSSSSSNPRHMMLLPPPTAPASVSQQSAYSQSGDPMDGGTGSTDMDQGGPAGMRLPFQQWMSQHAARLLLPHHMRNMADLFTADILWSTRTPGSTGNAPLEQAVHQAVHVPGQPASPGQLATSRPGALVPLTNRHGVLFEKPASGRPSSHRLLAGKDGPAVDMFCGRYPSKSVRQLASDSRFMADLLTELPGVDPTSAVVMNMVLGLAGHRGGSASERPWTGLVDDPMDWGVDGV